MSLKDARIFSALSFIVGAGIGIIGMCKISK